MQPYGSAPPERRPTQESVVTALPAGYATPDVPRFQGDADWTMVGPPSGERQPSGPPSRPPAGVPPELMGLPPAPPTETDALVRRTSAIIGKDSHAHMRDIVTTSAVIELSITPIILLLSAPNRGHHASVRPRGGDHGCHNMWVWLAFLALLDFVHLLLHQFEAVVEGKDCAMRRIFRGKGKDQDSETKEEADAQDLKDMTRLDHALHYGDFITLTVKVLMCWYGVWMVIGIGGFLLVSLAICLGGALVAATTVFISSAQSATAGFGAGTLLGLTIVAIFMAILVDAAMGSPCHDVLHFWSMLLASGYSVTLLIALGLLIQSLRESRFWIKRQFSRGRAFISTNAPGTA